MTTYRVPISDQLLAEKDYWQPVEGFRLVSVDGPWLAHPDVTICTFEDDGAPADLEGLLVEPSFRWESHAGHASLRIVDRSVINAE